MTPERAQEIAGALKAYLDLERRITDPETPRDELPGIVHGWIAAGRRVRLMLAETR